MKVKKRAYGTLAASLVIVTALTSCGRATEIVDSLSALGAASAQRRRPQPIPTQTPAQSSYTLSITSPSQNAGVSGTFQIKGSGPGFLNVEVYDASGNRLAQVTPSSSGAFAASVDSTKLANGSQTLTIDGWDSPAGQNFNHTDEKKLTVNVSNASSGGSTSSGSTSTGSTSGSTGGSSTSGSTGSATGGSSTPLGGVSGFSNLKVNDSFGSSKAGANFTSLSQFNSGTYGASGSGWDDHMCAWDCGKANLSMASDHLEIRPTGGPSGFISSHFEYLPSGSSHVYWEIRAATGRGDYSGGQTWPAFWLFAGNEPGSNNAQSEFDLMETYFSQQWGPYDSAAGGYTRHFVVTTHPNANSTLESFSLSTDNDITINYNVYGCDVYKKSDGNLYFDIYFNGQFMKSTSVGMTWNSSAPSMFLGWNPGSTSLSPAIMKVDYVKAWIK